jgi:hypothetical protein
MDDSDGDGDGDGDGYGDDDYDDDSSYEDIVDINGDDVAMEDAMFDTVSDNSPFFNSDDGEEIRSVATTSSGSTYDNGTEASGESMNNHWLDHTPGPVGLHEWYMLGTSLANLLTHAGRGLRSKYVRLDHALSTEKKEVVLQAVQMEAQKRHEPVPPKEGADAHALFPVNGIEAHRYVRPHHMRTRTRIRTYTYPLLSPPPLAATWASWTVSCTHVCAMALCAASIPSTECLGVPVSCCWVSFWASTW